MFGAKQSRNFLPAALLAMALVSSTAAAQCVRVLGYEWDGENQSMDPVGLLGTDNVYHVRAVYEPLVDRDEHLRPIPVLAESWESNSDGSVWTFKLRRGVKFHDGSELQAEDVVFTYRRLLDLKIAPRAAAGLSFLKADGIEAVDPYTVRFKLAKPVAELPLLIATKYAMVVSRTAKSEDLKLRENGTGPFIQERFTPNGPVRILKRNPNYWQSGLPKAECLEIKVVQEASSRTAAIMSGQADVSLAVDPVSLLTLRANPGVQLTQTKGATALYLTMWVDTPPFNDPKVRQALRLVVDRDAMVKTVLLGFGEVGNDALVPPSSPDAYPASLRKRDIAMAKRLLAEAGHGNGLKVDLYTSDSFPGMLLLAQAYAQMAAEAGIQVNVITAPAKDYWSTVWLKRPFLVTYMAARPPGEALAINLRSDAKWNESHWFRPDYDRLVDAASTSVSADDRRQSYQKAQQMVADEGGLIVPAFSANVSALRKGCTGYVPHVDVNRINYLTITCK